MKKLSLLFILIVSIAGCSTNPVKFENAEQAPIERLYLYQTPNKSSKLLVTRDSGYVGSACVLNFYIDGEMAGRFYNSEKATFYIDKGNHTIGVRSICDKYKITTTNITINENEAIGIRLYFSFGMVGISKI